MWEVVVPGEHSVVRYLPMNANTCDVGIQTRTWLCGTGIVGEVWELRLRLIHVVHPSREVNCPPLDRLDLVTAVAFTFTQLQMLVRELSHRELHTLDFVSNQSYRITPFQTCGARLERSMQS